MSNSTNAGLWTCSIDGVRLVNVNKTGKATITPGTNSIEWKEQSTPNSYDYTYTDPSTDGNDMFIIPQTTATATDLTGSYVEALCVVYGATDESPKLGFKDIAAYERYFQSGELKVTYTEGGEEYTGALYAKVGFPLNRVTFAPGTYYNFALNFVEKTIIAGDGYYDADGKALTLERNDGGEVVEPDKGEETTPDPETPIGIKVSVTNWPNGNVDL